MMCFSQTWFGQIKFTNYIPCGDAQKLCCSLPAQPWVGEQCLEQFVPDRYSAVSESREKKLEDTDYA